MVSTRAWYKSSSVVRNDSPLIRMVAEGTCSNQVLIVISSVEYDGTSENIGDMHINIASNQYKYLDKRELEKNVRQNSFSEL